MAMTYNEVCVAWAHHYCAYTHDKQEHRQRRIHGETLFRILAIPTSATCAEDADSRTPTTPLRPPTRIERD